MDETLEEKASSDYLARIIWIAVMMMLVGLFLKVALPAFERNQEMEAQKNALAVQLQRTERELQRQAREIRALRDDPYYLERVMRRELGLVMEGEVVLPEEPASHPAQRRASEVPGPAS